MYRGVVGLGGFAGHLQHLDGGGIVSDDMSKIIAPFSDSTESRTRTRKASTSAARCRMFVMSSRVKRLDQIVESAQLHGFDGTLHKMVGAHHDHDRGRASLA
jgi:hypothetical protein